MSEIVPARHQPPLPLDRLLVKDAPGAEAVEMDVVFVGGGPAGLAGAIELTEEHKSCLEERDLRAQVALRFGLSRSSEQRIGSDIG